FHYSSLALPALHSFPTRRSSDLSLMAISQDGNAISTASVGSEGAIGTIAGTGFVRAFTRALVQVPGVASQMSVPHLRRDPRHLRSEEHTSELQSLTNLVCRLLLE